MLHPQRCKVWLLFGSLSGLPIAAFLLFMSRVVYARFERGHWPTFNNPDPSLIGLQWVDLLVFVLLVLLAPAAPLGLASSLFCWRVLADQWRSTLSGLAAFTFVYAAFRHWLATDPGGFLNWWFD